MLHYQVVSLSHLLKKRWQFSRSPVVVLWIRFLSGGVEFLCCGIKPSLYGMIFFKSYP